VKAVFIKNIPKEVWSDLNIYQVYVRKLDGDSNLYSHYCKYTLEGRNPLKCIELPGILAKVRYRL